MRLMKLLEAPGTFALEGPGGVGKTRLALEASRRTAARMLFMDDRSQITATALPTELSGADHLILVVDNSHRRDDLRALVGLLQRRTGHTNLVLMARPGFRGRLADAVEGSALGPLTGERAIELAPLSAPTIGEIVRNASPPLDYPAAVDRAIALADGNPQIALLAHSVAVQGGALDQLGLSDLFAAYAGSLVASLIAHVRDGSEHEIRELLGVMAGLGYVDLDEADTLGAIAEQLGSSEAAVRRRLHDFADAGLVTQTGERFAVTPDVVSGHILWSSFFAEGPTISLRYRTIWEAFAGTHIGRLCDALGGLPPQAVDTGHAVGRYVADDLIGRAETDPGALELTRAVAPALPWLAAGVVDVALEHLPADAGARVRALVAASDALARTPDFAEGWPRHLAVAQAIFATPTGDESGTAEAARKKISEELTRVYSRVPLGVSPREGEVLAFVQHEMTRATTEFWRRYRDQPGAAEAVAIASRQLLTVTFENHHTSAEDDRRVEFQGCVLPASRWTKEALLAGSGLFVESLCALELSLQTDQVTDVGNLARAAQRFPGPFGATVDADVAALAREAQNDLVERLGNQDGLPHVTRAGLEDQLGQIWPADDGLVEFHLLFSSATGPRRRDAWEPDGRDARAQALSARLLAADDPASVVDRWSAWLVDVDRARSRDLGGWILQRALEQAAVAEPPRITPVLDGLIAEPGPLTGHSGPALAVTYNDTPEARQRAQDALRSEHELVRAVAVRAVGWSELSDRIDVLAAMVADRSTLVRRAVVDALRFGVNFDQDQLDLAIQACQPDDIDSLSDVVSQLDHARGTTPARFTDEQAAAAAQIVLAAANRDRLEGYELKSVVEVVRTQQPRLPFDFCRARIEHQRTAAGPRDLRAMMRVDTLPDELRSAVQEAARAEDVEWVLDQIESGEPTSPAYGTVRDLLEWLDDGSPVVTTRLAQWIRSNDDRLGYEARRVLDHPLSAEGFRERARALLAAAPSGELEDAIISARQPRVWSGTLHRYWRRQRDEFSHWTADEDETIAAVGTAAVDYYQQLLEREREPEEGGEDEDDEQN